MPIHDHLVGIADKKRTPSSFKDSISDEYEVIPAQAVAATKVLMDMWVRLGRPGTPFTDAGEKMMNIIIAVWEDGYPAQMRQWYKDRAEYRKNEMGLAEQVHQHTGRSLASYPLPIFNMMKRMFRNFDPVQRKNCIKMVKKWPMFQMANKI